MPSCSHPNRSGRGYVAVVVMLVGFGVLLFVVCHWYLLPNLAADAHAVPVQRRALVGAHARVALSVLLSILFMLVGLGLIVWVRHALFPPNRPPRKPTRYIDAWAESAKRFETPEE